MNPNGGAIALGHPLGMSGARLALTAVNAMETLGQKRAIATMCIGVGQGIQPALIEQVSNRRGMLLSLGLILLCQLVGEAIARGSGIPVPGPVIGLVLCVVLLLVRDKIGARLPLELRDGTFEQTGQGILSHLSLLFVPAGSGLSSGSTS